MDPVQSLDADPPGVTRIRAPNPSPMTLDGTNTYVVEGGWVVDPGPDDAGHVERVLAACGGRVAGIALTHGHGDHSDGAARLAAAAGGARVIAPRGGEALGPLLALATPGHSPDHVALLLGDVGFVGDTVMGAGSVFIPPDEGALAAYLDSLRRLRELGLGVLAPGHGPYVRDPDAKLGEYIDHRLERERMLLEALAAGARGEDELLDRAWADAPPALRPAAALTLRAHLGKLAAEGRLPDGVEP